MKILFILLACVAVAFGLPMNNNFTKCSKSDPNLESCLLKIVEAMRKTLIHGSSDLPAIDPFRMNYLHVNNHGIDIQASNIIAVGAGQFKINDFKVNLLESYYSLEGTIDLPQLTVTANYKASKFFFSLDGNYRGDFSGNKAFVKVTAKPTKKNGKTYLSLKKFSVRVTVGDGSISLGNGMIASFVEGQFKRDKRAKLDELSSMIESQVRPMAQKYIKNILRKIPVEDVLE